MYANAFLPRDNSNNNNNNNNTLIIIIIIIINIYKISYKEVAVIQWWFSWESSENHKYKLKREKVLNKIVLSELYFSWPQVL